MAGCGTRGDTHQLVSSNDRMLAASLPAMKLLLAKPCAWTMAMAHDHLDLASWAPWSHPLVDKAGTTEHGTSTTISPHSAVAIRTAIACRGTSNRVQSHLGGGGFGCQYSGGEDTVPRSGDCEFPPCKAASPHPLRFLTRIGRAMRSCFAQGEFTIPPSCFTVRPDVHGVGVVAHV